MQSFMDDIISRYVLTNWTGRSVLFVSSPYYSNVEKTGQVFMNSVDEVMELVEKSWRGYGSIRFSIHPRFQGINNVWYLERLMWDFDIGNENAHPRLVLDIAVEFARRLQTISGARPVVVFSGMKGAHVVAFLNDEIGNITQDKPQNVLEYVHSSLYSAITNELRRQMPGLDVLEDSGANYKVLTKLPYTRHEKTLSETHFVDESGYYVPPVDAVKYIDDAINSPITEYIAQSGAVDIVEYTRQLVENYEHVKKELEEKTAKAIEKVTTGRAAGRKNRFAELLLQRAPNDCKKRLMIVVLAPHLVNERGLSDEEAIEILIRWCVEGGGRDRECRTTARNAVKNARRKQLFPPHKPSTLLDASKGWVRAFRFDECKDLLRGYEVLMGGAGGAGANI